MENVVRKPRKARAAKCAENPSTKSRASASDSIPLSTSSRTARQSGTTSARSRKTTSQNQTWPGEVPFDDLDDDEFDDDVPSSDY
jgi:hypothetical protein